MDLHIQAHTWTLRYITHISKFIHSCTHTHSKVYYTHKLTHGLTQVHEIMLLNSHWHSQTHIYEHTLMDTHKPMNTHSGMHRPTPMYTHTHTHG